ncbi:MAG: RsmD family RNA methyltransferase [Planctomycetota bacterium]
MNRPSRQTAKPDEAASAPRIIGGEFRHRRLEFSPDPRTRPMKDRVRESLFDLIGYRVKGALALDLFAGSGAIGFEAVSRGAVRGVFCERHFPTADLIGRSAKLLDVEDRVEVRPGDVLLWARRMPELPKTLPWVVFISPPWEFFQSRIEEMMALVTAMQQASPPGSTLVVEGDTAFDPAALPDPEAWEVRPVPPAVLYLQFK